MTSIANLEGKTLSSTITQLNAPLTQAFGSQLSSEPTLTASPTPTICELQALRLADFDTLTEALEYAASGSK